MVRCAICHTKVGNGPKYKKHVLGLRHQSNLAKRMDPEWVDTRAISAPTRRLEALGLVKNRWITGEQYATVQSLRRIAGTGIPLDCFELTGLKTKLGFCTAEECDRAQVLLDSRTIQISDTRLEK